ncbi:hypothetical protein [Bartonella rattaustraliani]|uniref:hypothetical protein n=1 Tax=Bartonella rattaustraliani TaxID=481139 RepID=UPI0002E0EC2B|nr:hypothetical protein [Bartonella rattaustraliani]
MTIHTLAKQRKQTIRCAKNPFEVQKPFGDAHPSIKGESILKENPPYSEDEKTVPMIQEDLECRQFTKQRVSQIGLFYKLGSSGVKAFEILAWIFKNKTICKDPIPLDGFVLKDFLNQKKHSPQKHTLSLSLSTFSRGLAELEDAKIIAKHIRKGWYFINPNFVFSGEHVIFLLDVNRREKYNQNVISHS